jgi:sugar phosphate isomerase/epimerase
MKFAFSTIPFPQLSITAVADLAKKSGFDAIELAALPGDLNPAHQSFDEAGIAVACLSPAISIPRRRRQRRALLGELLAMLEAASKLQCHLLKLPGIAGARGQTAAAAAVDYAHWLAPLADAAAEHDVTLVIENSLAFSTVRAMWMLFESLPHPNLGASWDLSLATLGGESPLISIPTLNTHIRYARIRSGESLALAETFIHRLRGIGYAGYLTLQAPQPDLATWLAQLKGLAADGTNKKTHQR